MAGSTIWAQLSMPQSAAGSIPFVYSDGLTILTDVSNFWWNQTTHQLSINTNYDQTGTDSINTYYQQDSYWVYNPLVTTPLGASNTVAGHTVSTSRGTGQVPAINQVGDFVGKFSGWAYTGTAPGIIGYQELAGINIYVSGSSNSQNGAGGQLTFFTKQDNISLPVEWITLTNTGQLKSTAASNSSTSASLGAPAYGYSNLYLGYINNAVAGATVICNAVSGRVQMSAGRNSLTITNSFVTPSSIVIPIIETVDSSGAIIRSCVPTNGSFTITTSANSAGIIQISFLVIGN